MQPAALSVEPLIIISGLLFLFGAMPIAIWIVIKCKPTSRAIAISLALIGLVCAAFTLGRMTGLSMAWYHWRNEYKDPLWAWQSELKDRLRAGDTNGVINIVQRFGEEDVQNYGHEKLFNEGKFRRFVDELSKSPRTTAPTISP